MPVGKTKGLGKAGHARGRERECTGTFSLRVCFFLKGWELRGGLIDYSLVLG